MFLSGIKINGIKNIKEEVVISFSKKQSTTYEELKTDSKRIVGLFGHNGAGKTSIVIALPLLRTILFQNVSINKDDHFNKLFKKHINYETKAMNLTLDFLAEEGYYTYHITIVKDENDMLIIKNESYIFKAKSLSNNGTVIFKKENTELPAIAMDNLYKEPQVEPLLLWASKMVYQGDTQEGLDITNTKSIVLPKEVLENIKKQEKTSDVTIDMTLAVPIEDREQHKNLVKKFEYFIKSSVKKDLKKIDVNYNTMVINEEKSYNIKDITFIYENKRISFAMESAGIKRMWYLFNAIILSLNEEKLIVIDELDINFHYDIIRLLIDYNNVYGKAQLLFTAHNIEVINDLQRYKNTIIFITNSGKIITKVKSNGNYSIKNTYLNKQYEDSYILMNEYELYKVINDEC